MLMQFEEWINEFPPVDMDEQRYGNKAFSKWHAKLIEVFLFYLFMYQHFFLYPTLES